MRAGIGLTGDMDASQLYPLPGIQDPFSTFTHLVGAVVFLVLGIRLVRHGGFHWGHKLGLAVFSFAAVFLLSMSGVYHLLPYGAARDVFVRLDHAAIFVLIAASFTPIHAIVCRGWWRWGMLTLIWSMAITALVLKMVFFDTVPEWAGLVMYLGLGWMGLLSGVGLVRQYGLHHVRWVFWGGVAYTVGATLEFIQPPMLVPGVIGGHELFHVAVLAGIGFHWYHMHSISRKLPRLIVLPATATKVDTPQAT